MTVEDKKYEQILNMLKKSGPVLRDAEAISEKVIRQLTEERSKVSPAELIIEYLFGWTYIGWVRRFYDCSSPGDSLFIWFSAGSHPEKN